MNHSTKPFHQLLHGWLPTKTVCARYYNTRRSRNKIQIFDPSFYWDPLLLMGQPEDVPAEIGLKCDSYQQTESTLKKGVLRQDGFIDRPRRACDLNKSVLLIRVSYRCNNKKFKQEVSVLVAQAHVLVTAHRAARDWLELDYRSAIESRNPSRDSNSTYVYLDFGDWEDPTGNCGHVPNSQVLQAFYDSAMADPPPAKPLLGHKPPVSGMLTDAEVEASNPQTSFIRPSGAMDTSNNVLVTFVGRPNDEIVSIRCTVVKSETNALMRQTPKSNRFRRGGSEQERADHSRYGAALRSRLDPSLAGPSSIFIRLRKVRASDLIPSLTVNDVVHSDPDSMLGAASDYFERLEEAYPLEEMTKAQAAFLCAVSLGPKARQWYRATYTNQSASIFLNGWLSATFDILSGVRQGDPLAPSLFVLAIEGFACQIRLRVKGIDIAGLQNVRKLLFADDACCALHNLSDLDHLNRAIELYERASASKLSNVKSFLYPLGAFRDRSIAPDLGTWRLSDSQFRYLGIQVGVEIAEDAGWEDVKASTIARIRSIPMYDLPYAAKCSIINIYCYTKILYYSRFLPAPKSVVKEIEEAVMLAIHGRASNGTQRRPKVSRSRLCTPLDHGGFGLIDLPWRLAIDHAKWVFQLRAPDGCFTRHLFDIRIRLQAPNEPTPFTLSRPAPNQHRCPWIWIWWAYFCHPPPKWDHAVRKTTKLLPARWVRYFEAWALVTTLNPPELSKSQNLEQWATHVLYFPAGHGIQLSVNPTLFRGPDGEVMTPSSFVNASKRHQVFIFPPIFPKGHQKVFDLPEQRWNAWWKALRKVRRVHSDAEDTGHLLSLGSLHPGSQVASPTSPHPNNRSTSCVMCLSEAPECLVHLAVGCPFARRLWSALSPTPHPVFVDFVCPVVSRSERRLVELRVLFFHSIWKLCRRRRFSSDLLEPITETEFEGLRASIQESKGRLVSLFCGQASCKFKGSAWIRDWRDPNNPESPRFCKGLTTAEMGGRARYKKKCHSYKPL
ncbi:BQ5605_C023g09706 [Microbotryum silenes-dioicae]|uniref:BQ5605_C023g09706 protein n=1 Tax=Microbotryum silenes-dioicae TaxID=796604 RepID=A0A2X0MLD7_9BASI|nr:BQ5605_C023g09706 [Microbotryum silenes-dioicae]